MMTNNPGAVLIVTGNRGTGKSTLCSLMVEAARAAGWTTGGVWSPARVENEQKTAIEAEDLRSGERRLLATPRIPPDPDSPTPEWKFDPTVLEWADRAMVEGQDSDLLVVDELGPLELERGAGWQGGIQAVDHGDYRLALVVIRPELLAGARGRWPRAEVITLMTVQMTPALVNMLQQEYFLGGWSKNQL
jgi:nucleoside-triphosphatase